MPTSFMPPDPNDWSWFRVLLYATFASLGGILGHVMRSFDKNEKVRWLRAVIEGVAAGFVGLLVFFACNASGLSEQWTGVVVGVSGWLGANATIRILEALVYKKLGLQRIRNVDENT